jgi:WD40 repeat protein
LEGKAAVTLLLWDLTASKSLGRWPETMSVPDKSYWKVTSPDGRYLAFRDPLDPTTIQCWDWMTQRVSSRLAGRSPHGTPLFLGGSFSPDGALLTDGAVLGDEGVVRIWDLETRDELFALRRSGTAYWAPGGRILITQAPTQAGNEEGEGASRLSRDFVGGEVGGRRIAANLRETHLQFWEVTRPTPTHFLAYPVRSLLFSPDESRLAVNNTIWQVNRTSAGPSLSCMLVAPSGLRVTPGSGQDAWGGELTDVEPFALALRLSYYSFEERKWRDYSLPPADHSALETRLRDSIPWAGKNSRNGDKITFYPSQFAFGPDGTKIFLNIDSYRVSYTCMMSSGSSHVKHCLEYCDLKSRKRLHFWDSMQRAPAYASYGRGFKVSPNGRHVAVTGRALTKEITLIDLGSGEEVASFADRVTQQVEFSPEGQFILGAELGNKPGSKRDWLTKEPDYYLKVATVYDARDGRELRSWETEPRSWGAAAVGPGGRVVASGGEDRMIHLWDVDSGRELVHWPAHDGAVTALRFSKDGATLYCGSSDGALKLWNLPFIRKELTALGLDW